MDSRYTGVFPTTLEEQRRELAQYMAATQGAKKRQQLANAYLAQASQAQPPKQQVYRCERCGI